MSIYVNGLNLETLRPLIRPVEREVLGAQVLSALVENEDEIKGLSFATSTGTTYRGELERERTPDLGDPNAVGWTVLVAERDPRRDEFLDALRPLAEHRGMLDPEQPMVYPPMEEDEWFDWLQEFYFGLDKERPFYILIAGGPEHIPFRLQARLDSAAAVGRLDPDSPDDIRAYVDKVLRNERAADRVTDHEALFFAPDGGQADATYFSHHYLATPLAERCTDRNGVRVRRLFEGEARKLLLDAASGRPGLVFTASHGMEAGLNASPEEKRRINGAICCQQAGDTPVDEWLLTAADVLADTPFFDGSVFFQFACFGYGTPAESDFNHWTEGGTRVNAPEDFTAALSKRLVSHPLGPLAVVAHLDLAWLHGFDDPKLPHPVEQWHPRITPFDSALAKLLSSQPVGLAMEDFNKRFDLTNAQLASTVDRLQRGRLRDTPELRASMADIFVLRTDAQNYMVLGDPAVRLRLSA